ncbi:MAG: HAD-IA family hydrolase [Clostridiales bacterium]|nr:HAD-IA family hydrolase [Clostridiales bacterium]
MRKCPRQAKYFDDAQFLSHAKMLERDYTRRAENYFTGFMRYKLIIFDMDGTILDTLEDLTDSMNYALKKSGFPERSISEVRGFVGNGIRKLIERAVPANTPADMAERVLEDFTEHYRQNCSNKTRPYDGIPEILSALRDRGVLTAVVSNKADFAVQQLCIQYFDGLFDMALGERADIRKKPAPDAVYAVLEHTGTEKKDALYIGDSEVDIQTAENAGLDCICVGWGFRGEDFLRRNGAAVVLKTADEILRYV